MTRLNLPADLQSDPAPKSEADTGIREDLLHPDPLLDCLVELTRIHGRPSTRADQAMYLAKGSGRDKVVTA